MNPALLAHQGGWDEALLVLVPIAFIFAMLYLAKRKAERRPPAGAEASGTVQDPVRASDGDT